ncbi:MAG: hypothetical protein H6735_25260 [Alphaproteobacteria bacterium]|nr:hypothetical protein [Alphaproteobacteria bacterium]
MPEMVFTEPSIVEEWQLLRARLVLRNVRLDAAGALDLREQFGRARASMVAARNESCLRSNSMTYPEAKAWRLPSTIDADVSIELESSPGIWLPEDHFIANWRGN